MALSSLPCHSAVDKQALERPEQHYRPSRYWLVWVLRAARLCRLPARASGRPLALVANGLEHACGQRIELALDGGLGP
jgi:hypothetical protein